MKTKKCYVYCEGILGVKTNISNFKWVYGSNAPIVSQTEYEQCAVKFEIFIRPEKRLRTICACDQFQSYFWDAKSNTLSCRRNLLGSIALGYDISITEEKILVEIGSNYYRFVKKRVMNLHAVYYLLADLANLLLLRKGYLTLYASCVHYAPGNKGMVFFAPPNTGKTVTATRLCSSKEYSMVGEDVIIIKDHQIYSCPFTASYRKRRTLLDSTGSIGRVDKAGSFTMCKTCEITDVFILASGEERIACDREEIMRKITILNGYLFQYYSSPIIKILGYFDFLYCNDWNALAKEKLEQIINTNKTHILVSRDAIRYSVLAHRAIGELV